MFRKVALVAASMTVTVAALNGQVASADHCGGIGDPNQPAKSQQWSLKKNATDYWDSAVGSTEDTDRDVGSKGILEYRDGIVRLNRSGELYLHPVASIQFALKALENYEASGDTKELQRGTAGADDIIRMGSKNDLLPYSFEYRTPNGFVPPIPWYSAMAQGEALSVASRMYLLTGESKYRKAADDFFSTLTVGDEFPAVTFIDDAGYLWLEEYSIRCPSRVLNGHIFAAFGLWDYWRATGNSDAEAMFRAAAATVLAYMPTLRIPGKLSRYSIDGPASSTSETYHEIHQQQLRSLGAITQDARFDEWADLLERDTAGGPLIVPEDKAVQIEKIKKKRVGNRYFIVARLSDSVPFPRKAMRYRVRLQNSSEKVAGIDNRDWSKWLKARSKPRGLHSLKFRVKKAQLNSYPTGSRIQIEVRMVGAPAAGTRAKLGFNLQRSSAATRSKTTVTDCSDDPIAVPACGQVWAGASLVKFGWRE